MGGARSGRGTRWEGHEVGGPLSQGLACKDGLFSANGRIQTCRKGVVL